MPRSLVSQQWHVIDRAARDFERAWQAGTATRIEELLPGEGPERWEILIELVHIELELRRRAGEPARCEEYLDRFPELGNEADVAIELIAAEYRLAGGDSSPALRDEFLRRFPRWRDRLLHVLLASNDQPAGAGHDGPPANRAAGPDPSLPPEQGSTVFSEGCSGRGGKAAKEAATSGEGQATKTLPAIAGYELLEELGRGGMGVVYKAWQPGLKRAVALKMILAGPFAAAHVTEELRLRFRREAELAAGLRHPHIVQVHEIGAYDGWPYLALEFMDGGSLAEYLAERALPLREAAEVVEVLARAVQYAHESGVIHRDLKPGNVLLQKRVGTRRGGPATNGKAAGAGAGTSTEPADTLCERYFVKVGDFGLARELDSELTRTQHPVGTPSYMAPEQADGSGQVVGVAADVYGLGAILYRLVTGRPPFKGRSSVETLMLVRHETPPSPRRLRAEVPRDLEMICLKALAKRPEDRYATSQALAEDLRRWLDGEPVKARPLGLAERLGRWCRQNQLAASLATATVLLSVVTVVALAVSLIWVERERDLAVQDRNRAEEANKLAQERDAETRRHLYVRDMGLAMQAWRNQDPAMAVENLKRYVPEAGQADLRGFEWHHLWHLCHPEPKILEGHSGAVYEAVYSPDGKVLATASLDSTIKLWHPASGKEIRTLRGHKGDVNCVTFSPSGASFAFTSGDGTITFVDARAGKITSTLRCSEMPYSLAFSPDDLYLAAVTRHGRVWLADLLWGEMRSLPAAGNRVALWGVSFLPPHGNQFATAGGDGKVRLWRIDQFSRRTQHVTADHERDTCLCVSPDSKKFAIGCDDGNLRLQAFDTWGPPTRLELQRFPGKEAGQQVAHIIKVPLCDFLKYLGIDWHSRIRRHLDMCPVAECITSAAFSPDGKLLAAANRLGTVGVFEADSGRLRYRLRGVPDCPRSNVVFSSDGTKLFQAGMGGARCWEATTGVHLTDLLHADGYCHVLPEPSSKTVAVIEDTSGVVRLWDPKSMQWTNSAWSLSRADLMGELGQFSSAAIAPSGGTLILYAGPASRLSFYDLATRRVRNAQMAHDSRNIESMAISPDGATLATSGNDHTVRLWHMATGLEIFALDAPKDVVGPLVFSPDGKMLVGRTARAISVWHAADVSHLYP